MVEIASYRDTEEEGKSEQARETSVVQLSAAQVSLYFTQFVIARIGISLPLLLIRIPAILSLLARTKPEPAYCIMETEITNIAIVFVIGSMYCVIAPVIMPACLIYFGLAFGIYKWLFTHVYETEFDCAGEMWYSVFNGLIIGMMFGMLSVCGIASIYAGARSLPPARPHSSAARPSLRDVFGRSCGRPGMAACRAGHGHARGYVGGATQNTK